MTLEGDGTTNPLPLKKESPSSFVKPANRPDKDCPAANAIAVLVDVVTDLPDPRATSLIQFEEPPPAIPANALIPTSSGDASPRKRPIPSVIPEFVAALMAAASENSGVGDPGEGLLDWQ